jgi:phytoene/squalene synthetase
MVVQQVRRVDQEEWRNGLLLDAWREQVEQARRGQEAGRSLTQGLARNSADAYEDIPRLYSRLLRCEREGC